VPVPAAAGVRLQEQQLLLGLPHGEECWEGCFAAAPACCANGDAGEAGQGEQQGQRVLLDLAALQHDLGQACRIEGDRAGHGGAGHAAAGCCTHAGENTRKGGREGTKKFRIVAQKPQYRACGMQDAGTEHLMCGFIETHPLCMAPTHISCSLTRTCRQRCTRCDTMCHLTSTQCRSAAAYHYTSLVSAASPLTHTVSNLLRHLLQPHCSQPQAL
jgi:hypothetical protein